MNTSKVPFHKAAIGEEEINQVVDTLRSGWLTMGPKTIEFESQFSHYLGVGHSVSMNSATACLHLALKAIGLSDGDEVIVPAMTFISTAEVVTYFNAKPVICDINESDHNIDVSKIESLVTKNTKAIIPVHFAGIPCDINAIHQIAKKYDLKIIEDAAHALPSKYKGQLVGSLSDITCFSFYATKTLVTGEGGMATTNNFDYALSMKQNRLHGMDKNAWNRYSEKGNWYYEIVDRGYKYNMTDVSASLGLVQLKRVEELAKKRASIADRYNAAFSSLSHIQSLSFSDDVESSWHLFVVKVNNRDELMAQLATQGIGTSLHFIPIHYHPYYKDTYGYNLADYPNTNKCYDMSMSLPIYPDMTDDQVQQVIDSVINYAT